MGIDNTILDGDRNDLEAKRTINEICARQKLPIGITGNTKVIHSPGYFSMELLAFSMVSMPVELTTVSNLISGCLMAISNTLSNCR